MLRLKSILCCLVLLSLAFPLGNAWAKKPRFNKDLVSAITLDVVRMEACASGKGCVVASGPMQLDLLELADGKVDFANKVLLPEKTQYLQLMFGANSTITVDDELFPLSVPGGTKSGLKLKGRKAFGKEGGFLTSLELQFKLGKKIVAQRNKIRSKDKGKRRQVSYVYSYKLKPVIRVRSAEVEQLPENMAAVVALPDEDAILNLGDDSSILIPAGAVSETTIIRATPRQFFIEVTNQATGDTLELPPLSPIYNLSPSGLTFDLPLNVRLHYDETVIPKGFTEDDLVAYHDGDPITSTVDKDNNIVITQISHFSALSVDVYITQFCKKQPAIVDSDGKAIAGINHILCPDFVVEDLDHNNVKLPDFHLIEGDRKRLSTKYRMDVISIDAETGGQETHPVNKLATMNNAVVAINGNHFTCLTKGGLFGKGCYDGGTGRATRIHIEDGKVKGKNGTGNVVFAFGGSSDSLVPIERLKTSEGNEDGNHDRLFNPVFLQEFKTRWGDAVVGTKIQVENGVLNSAIGEGTTLLYTSDKATETICKYTGDTLPEEGLWPAFGYSKSKIFFLASDKKDSTVSDWKYFDQLCLVLRTKQAENAILLDGGGSTQLAVRRPSGAGTEIITANNDTDDLRHVVNAIALVPKDQIIVSSVSPLTAILNESTIFTVTGHNLPSTLAFWLEECEDVTPLPSILTSRLFRCTPSYMAGERKGVVMYESGGTVLKGFTVNVVDTPADDELVLKEVRVTANETLYEGSTATYRATADFSNNVGQGSLPVAGNDVLESIDVTDQCTWSATPAMYVTSLDNGVVKALPDSAGYEVKVTCKYYDSINNLELAGTKRVTVQDIDSPGGDTTCTFPDVDQTAFYADEVNAFCSAGIIIGQSVNGERLFMPTEATNLAETLKVLIYAYDYVTTDNRPKDIEPWYSYYIAEAQKKGLAVTESMAGDPVLRREVMDYIVKIFYGQTVADPVQFLVDEGITNGSSPDMSLNRSELVVLAYRAAEKTGTIADIDFGRITNWDPSSSLSLDVPYLNQLDIPTIGEAACASASSAMVLAFHGKINNNQQAMIDAAETIFSKTSSIYKGLLSRTGLENHLEGEWNFSSVNFDASIPSDLYETIQEEIRAGRPLILGSRSMTGAGHYMVVTGYDGNDYRTAELIINDPYGEWLGFDRYNKAKSGKALRYDYTDITSKESDGVFVIVP